MPNHETLQKARAILTKSILSGPRPDPDEMFLLSDAYQQVWADHDKDWTTVLDDPPDRNSM